MGLSKRLSCIAGHIEGVDCAADIGTDHAYLPIALIREGRAKRVIAMDVREQPLKRAERNIREAGVQDQIELRLSDGAQRLKPGEASVISIAGMGGALMTRILKDRLEVFLQAEALYLSPQSEIGDFRRSLMELGFCIRDEWMLQEEQQFYVIMEAGAGQEDRRYTPCELRCGRALLQKKDPVLWDYLSRERRIKEQVLEQLRVQAPEAVASRKQELIQDLKLLSEAAGYYQEGEQ
jgi:tRNA (adenine22-N1)-methyltransferase